jgi:hypothetical protein
MIAEAGDAHCSIRGRNCRANAVEAGTDEEFTLAAAAQNIKALFKFLFPHGAPAKMCMAWRVGYEFWASGRLSCAENQIRDIGDEVHRIWSPFSRSALCQRMSPSLTTASPKGVPLR